MVNFVPLIPKFIMQKSIRLVSGLYLKLSLLPVPVEPIKELQTFPSKEM